LPVGQEFREDLRSESLMLGEGEGSVLCGEWRQGRREAIGMGLVERGELVDKEGHGPIIGQDAVAGQQE